MPEINVLPRHIAELIAAGEVVERPASVVKEIMENSIDAGADKITLEIRRGGVSYIRITDNGCGIDRQNVKKAFISHATSKISIADDLNSIYTLGFRGEALASIAAVSRVEMMTRAEGEEIGTRYCIDGGEEVLIDDAGCPVGTTLIIRDIFYNTPARMKFLKKDVTEANAVAAVVDRIALSHPEVSIRFIRDDKDALLTPGDGKTQSAVYTVLGRDFASTLIPADYTLEGVRVSGFVSKPFNSRPNRTMQYFFLNGRFVKTRTGMAALEEAYRNQIMAGKFPACVLNIEIPARAVDVNVHPAKTEVRFENEKLIFNAVYYCTKSALQQGDSRVQVNLQSKLQAKANKQSMPAPTSGKQLEIYTRELEKVSKEDFWQKTDSSTYRSEAPRVEKKQTEPVKPTVAEPTRITFNDSSSFKVERDEMDLLSGVKPKQAEPVQEAVEEPERIVEKLPEERAQTEPFKVIGEAFKTYILVQQGEKLLIIDKHAAHERMIFESLKNKNEPIETQLLLAPVTVTLSKEEYSAVLENLEVLEKAGYTVEDFGGGMVIVSECPTAVADADIQSVIAELAGLLMNNRRELVPEKLDWILHSTACRAAIKAGDRTTAYEQEQFVKQLLENPDIRYCPHGRPVLIEMTKHELEKNFGRI